MPPITWQNVNAPSRSRSASDFGSVNNMITGGFDAIGDALITRQADLRNQYDTKVDKNTDNYLDAVANINTLDALNSDQTAAQLTALRNAGPIDQDAIRGAVESQRTSLMDRTNTRDTFNLGQAKVASRPLLENIDSFVANESVDELRSFINTNATQLRASGDLGAVTAQLSGLEDKLETEAGVTLADQLLQITAPGTRDSYEKGQQFLTNNTAAFEAANGLGAAQTSLANLEEDLKVKDATRIESEFQGMLAGNTAEHFVAAGEYLEENREFLTDRGKMGSLRNQLLLKATTVSDKFQADQAQQALVIDEGIVTNATDELARVREDNPTDQLTSVEELEDFAAVDAKAMDKGWDPEPWFYDDKSTAVYKDIIGSETPDISKNTDNVLGFANNGRDGNTIIKVPVNVQRGLMMQAVGDLGKATDSWISGENDIDDVKEELKGNYRTRVIEWFKQKRGEISIKEAEDTLRIARQKRDERQTELNRQMSDNQIAILKRIMNKPTQ